MARLFAPRKERREPAKPVVVFYHNDCTDGFTAAWVAWKKFGDKAKYIGLNPSEAPPMLHQRRIYTLDMSFSGPITEDLMRDNQLTSIDHHISNKEVTLSTFEPSYALNHSGCVLAWQYFFPKKAVPKFLLNVEDVDLWNNKITDSHILYAYLELFEYSFKNWSKLISDFEVAHKRTKMIDTGRLLQKHEDEMMKYDIEKFAKLVEFGGHRVYAINTTRSSSAIGAILVIKRPPFSIIWKEHKDGIILVSLRGDGSFDCSKLAAKYGGGGHHNSSGFTLPSLDEIPWKAVKMTDDVEQPSFSKLKALQLNPEPSL